MVGFLAAVITPQSVNPPTPPVPPGGGEPLGDDDYFGPLNPAWVPDAPVENRTPYVDVNATRLYNDPLGGHTRGVAVDQGSPVWLRMQLADMQDGSPITLSMGGYSTQPTVQVKFREATGLCPTVWVPDIGDVPNLSSDGVYVYLPLPVEVKNAPGVYRAQTRVLRGDGVEVARDELFVSVQRGMWLANGNSPSADAGPPTHREIRLALRDHPAANRLLGEFEFDAAELGQAVVSTVLNFNQVHPQCPQRLDTRNFPIGWRRESLDGIVAYLLETSANYCRRGTLPYAAGGVSVDDLKRERELLAAAQMYRDRYEKWAKRVKMQLSVAAAWGSQGSGSPACIYRW